MGSHETSLFGTAWGSKPRAVITILAPRKGVGKAGEAKKWRRAVQLERMLKLLDIHFNDQFQYPVIIFHEDMTPAQMREVRSWTRSNVVFSSFSFERPVGISAGRIFADHISCCVHNIASISCVFLVLVCTFVGGVCVCVCVCV